jgi:hypothetical protein
VRSCETKVIERWVEKPECRQRLGKVVLDELGALIAGEAPACRLEHEFGEVKAHANQVGLIDAEEGEQAAVARPEVKMPRTPRLLEPFEAYVS